MNGNTGKIFRMDLSARELKIESPPENLYRKFIGGTGLCAHYLASVDFARIDPLGAENPLIFMTGPLVGTSVPSNGRYAVAAKSPLTGVWGEADCGGRFGPLLKKAGFDGFILTGKSSVPVVLAIIDGKVELIPTDGIWGKDTFETSEILAAKYGKDVAIATIGVAGEREIPAASIMTEGEEARAAGRCGLGAVMGSKRVKAIVVGGSREIKVYDAGRLKEIVKSLAPSIVQKGKRLHDTGTAGGVVGAAAMGDMGANNWSVGDCTARAEEIGGGKMAEEHFVRRYYCPSCIIGCGKVVRIPTGRYKGTVAGGPEYETLAGFGANSGVFDLAKVLEANDLCNRYGMDTIAVSNTINFLFEAAERGFIQEPEGKPQLGWGRGDTMISLIHDTANQVGLGVLIGKGVRAASDFLGSETKSFALHVKGLDMAYHDPRAQASLAVAYATNPRGACHRGCTHNLEKSAFPDLGYNEPLERMTSEGKGKAAAVVQNFAELFNCLKLCQFYTSSYGTRVLTDFVNAATGWDMTMEELLAVGERSCNLKRLLNMSCGLTKADDTLPSRLLKEPYESGGSAGNLPNLEMMLSEYYAERGWDEEGLPGIPKLEELGLCEYPSLSEFIYEKRGCYV